MLRIELPILSWIGVQAKFGKRPLVPIKNSLAYESSEEGVDCDVCSEKIPIRQWALHMKDALNSVLVPRNDALTN